MKQHYLYIFLLLTTLYSCNQTTTSISAYDLVNPFIGTGGHGHTYPGATMPFGMVQLSPDTRLDGWDGCSGYHYSDSIIYGFSHTHLSGTGVSDYGDILIMPVYTEKDITYNNLIDRSITATTFSKRSEIANPGFYQVDLAQARVKLTATKRVGIHHYEFTNKENNYIILDLNHRDKVLDYQIDTVNNMIIGKRISKAWATEQHVYFAISFSEDFSINPPKNNIDSADYFRVIEFEDNYEVIVKVGVSATTIQGAIKNLETEAPHWNFEQYKTEAKNVWEKALTKIEVEDENQDNLSIFYSALYHTLIVPNIFSDVDGKYRGMDQKIHQSKSKNQYTVFSLWDTFRATHPLYTIIEQEKTKDFIQSFLNHYKQGGRLPVWELAGNETDCMIGYHAVPVIFDAFVKGIDDFDVDLAFEAMMHSANLDHLGLKHYKKNGVIAAGDEAESVSKTLEYAYDDWCIAEMAKILKQDSIYKLFIKRAQYYKNIHNPSVGFMQARMNGSWTNGFKPSEVNFNFTEANSWQYSLFAPHDIAGLINLYGGDVNFDAKLDELFSTEMNLSGRHQVDITGLIGQYAHGNEPSHHMAYLYNYIGKPYKTQEMVNKILTEQYQNAPDGLSGNEDCGQMSAWYVLSSMGFYSVTPGMNYYTIGKPHFSKVTINLENGKSFTIEANNLSDKNIYIESVTMNGEDHPYAYIKHADIINGGEMIFEMSDQKNENWGLAKEHRPKSFIEEANQIVPTPYFKTNQQTFSDSLLISLENINNSVIYYQIDEDSIEKFNKPFYINQSCQIKAFAKNKDKESHITTANYKKIKGGRSIELLSEYSNEYAASGKDALIDYLTGSANFRTGYWQGYQGQSITFIVDLGSIEQISKVGVGSLQDIKSWIWFPKNALIWTSTNNKDYVKYGLVKNDFPLDKYGAFTKTFVTKKRANARYVKVTLEYPGDCPDWHLGKGGKAWVFIDEVTID